MSDNDEIFDPYTVVIRLTRSWSNDAVVSAGRNPSTDAEEALELLVSSEFQAAIDQGILNGKFSIEKINPPKTGPDQATTEAEHILAVCRDILTSAHISSSDLLQRTWDQLIGVITRHPEILSTKPIQDIRGLTINLSLKDYNDICASMQAGKKIQAIKKVREVTGMGLKEAKDTVEGHNWDKIGKIG